MLVSFAAITDIFSPFSWLANGVQYAMLWMLHTLIWMITSSPEPHLTQAWFRGEYGIMLQLAMWVMLPVLFAATIGALLYGGMQQLLRTYLWALPISVLGGVALIGVVELCLAADTEMTSLVFGRTEERVQTFYDHFNASTNAAEAPASFQWSLVQLFFMFLTFIPVFFMVIEMIFRQIMIYMAVMFFPLALAAFMWGPIRLWVYNLSELIITMIFAKFVLAAIMSLGFTALGYATTGDGAFSDQQIGLMLGFFVVMWIASFSGPVMVAFIMQPSHAILSLKSAKQVTPWNHDRKWAGQLAARQYSSVKKMFSSKS